MLTLLDLIDRVAVSNGKSIAFLGVGCRPITYEGLVGQLRLTAASLAAVGVRRNDRVAIVLPNGPDLVVSFLAVSSVATSAPLNPAYSFDEFRFYLGDLKAKVLLTATDFAPAATKAAESLDIRIIRLEPVTGAEAGVFKLANASSDAVMVEYAQADDVALVLHTSGTTSRPKIVPLTHRNLVCSAGNIARSLELTSQDCCLNVMPLFHVHGLIGAVLSSLNVGASVVCTPGFYAADFFGWLKEFQPTWYTAVPTMHQAIVSRAASHGGIRHRLRFIRSCSSALAPKLMAEVEAAMGVPVIEAYGMTEASHQMACNPLPPGTRKPGSVGLATGQAVSAMDRAGQLLAKGVTGEIVIQGENVTHGYESNEKANLESFVKGWFRTGDEGYLDEDGYVFLTGRIKEIINRGGEKISPREIDEVLLEHPAVAQAVAFAMPDPNLGEEVAAAVVLRDQATTTEQALRSFAATRLAHFKVPAKVAILRDLPKGPTGKLQRVNMAKLLGLTGAVSAQQPRPDYIAPQTAMEKTLAGIWAEVLRIGSVGVQDNFYQLGGDSLTATRMAARLRQEIQAEVSLVDLLAAPTLGAQAALVEKSRPVPAVDEFASLLDQVENMTDEQAQALLEMPSNDTQPKN